MKKENLISDLEDNNIIFVLRNILCMICVVLTFVHIPKKIEKESVYLGTKLQIYITTYFLASSLCV